LMHSHTLSQHQRRHLELARSVNDAAEEQRAWATIGRTFLFRYEADQSQDSLREAEGAFRKSLYIVDERLEGKVLSRELSEMRARLYLNLGFVYDGLKDSQRCSDFIRRSVFIAEQNKLLEDLYRANFNLGSIHFRNGQHTRAVRCLEHAKECARKMKEKFLESECYHSIGQVLLNLGDFVAAKRALKKAYTMGSQQPSERGAVRRNLKYAIKGCRLEEALAEQPESDAQGIVGMTEQLGDLYCKVGCYRKALDSYQAQLSGAQSLGKPARELSAIHVSLAATYTDLKQHKKAVEHYRKELALREGSPVEECETWLNIALSLEEDGRVLEELEGCYQSALECAQRAGLPKLQGETPHDSLREWLRMYGKHLDQETRQECRETENLLKTAASGRADDLDWANEDEADEDPPIRSVDLQDSPVSMRKEYQRAIQSLGSAKSRLLMSNSLSEPGSTLVTMVSASSRSALVPEEEYVADDWLEDDIGEVQSKKRRRISSGQEARREAVIPAKSTRGQPASVAIPTPTSRGSASRGMSMKKGHSRQVKMTQLSGMVVLGSRRSGSPLPFTQEEQSSSLSQTPVQHHLQAVAPALPAPIRVRVRVQDNVFLIPIPRSEAETCTVSWLADQAAQRYYQACGLHPHLSLQKEGALLAPQDMILHVLHSNEEVLAEVRSWDLPSLLDRYRKACQSLSVDENRTLSRLCELQDGSPCLSASHLSLQPRCIAPLLRCLKLQACLKELRLPGNRLHDSLMGELIATATTMPSLRILDLSANHITGEGLKQACVALEGQSQTVFPSLEELDLSLNLLGDSISQSLASLVLACPLLATLRLQGCGLSACFLQHHRPLLASALTGTGLLKTVCLSHNALGSMGVELVLRTMPLNSLTRLELSAIRLGPADHPIMDHVIAYLTQVTLPEHSIVPLTMSTAVCVCLPVCPSLVSLDLSGNPGVTAAGLQTLLSVLKEGHCKLQSLNLAGLKKTESVAGAVELNQTVRVESKINSAIEKMEKVTAGEEFEFNTPKKKRQRKRVDDGAAKKKANVTEESVAEPGQSKVTVPWSVRVASKTPEESSEIDSKEEVGLTDCSQASDSALSGNGYSVSNIKYIFRNHEG
ncbi:Tonsoku-like protein, partial [Acipenser ruthenus]